MSTKTKASKTQNSDYLARVRGALGHLTHERAPRLWLDTGSAELNGVIGDPDRGLAFGKILEVSGPPSNGKSTLALELAACGQQQFNAHVIWLDFENSFDQPENPDDNSWYQRRGLECHRGSPNFSLLAPYVGVFGTEKRARLITAEELLSEGEAVMNLVHTHQPDIPQIVVVDSVTAMLPEDMAAAGIDGQNMKTTMALPVLLGDLLRRWVGTLPEFNALAIFINQLRTKPGVMFGNPEYTPGGNALPFYAHVRVKLRRKGGGGAILHKGKKVGIKGVLINSKNKSGGIEGESCGFYLYNDGRSKFVPAEDISDKALEV